MKNFLLFLGVYLLAIIFGFGLSISSMINPAVVIGFLDIFGNWQPALMFVMGFGVLLAVPFFYFAKKRDVPIFRGEYPSLPNKIDKKLIIGAAIFGIGWGLGGICPGPLLVNIGIAPLKILPFLIAMLIGGWISEYVLKK